jgi:hypothetical protein
MTYVPLAALIEKIVVEEPCHEERLGGGKAKVESFDVLEAV